jgi:hypothetical protein
MYADRPENLYRIAPASVPTAVPQPEQPFTSAYRVPQEEEGSLARESWRPSGFLEWFAVGQTLLPALLFVPGNQPFRAAIRASAFLISLVALLRWYFGRKSSQAVRHPAYRWLMFVLVVLSAMILHPDTDNLLAGVGQIVLYVAVFCPIFWVPALVSSRRQLIRVLAILLVCNGINSVVGVLQVYDPDRWMPAEFSSTFMFNRDMLQGSTYIGPNGRRIIRPPGLFDTPGAVCGAGTVAALLGLIFALEKVAWWKRAVALGLSAGGMAAVYLSHVRASAVVGAGMLVTYLLMLLLQQQRKRATGFVGLAVTLIMLAFSTATLLGGDSIRGRFMSLFESNPKDLYYESRGAQLESAFNDLLVEFPLGAGLARWGVMSNYAGSSGTPSMWAEIQPAAWILDGGIFLLGLYSVALLATLGWELRLVRRLSDSSDRVWAAAIVAANIGTLALVATFVPFTTQVGLQFWFLEGILHGAMATKLNPR